MLGGLLGSGSAMRTSEAKCMCSCGSGSQADRAVPWHGTRSAQNRHFLYVAGNMLCARERQSESSCYRGLETGVQVAAGFTTCADDSFSRIHAESKSSFASS